MTDRGKFITIEGVEGSGKTTQVALLSEYLRNNGVEVVQTREPGGTDVGEKIRQILLSPLHGRLAPSAELLLFLAARAQQVHEVIMPALKNGAWIVCDRFSDATVAYQGHGRGIDTDTIRRMNDAATQGLKPDLTILLDLDVEIGIQRAIASKKEFAESGTGDRMEKETRAFHRRVQKGYHELAEREPGRIKVIPVTGSIEDVHRIIVSMVEPFLVKLK
ncbi:MAG: dTMP kinase [Candidatus Abyssubacteria bacterium]